jgi:hypothetical protein
MATLTVGPAQAHSTLAAAVAASAPGDVIEVQAGTYVDDFATIVHPLTIKAVGGMATIRAESAPPDGKAILTVRADLSLEGFILTGARVPAGNGAAIRHEGGDLVIVGSWLHGNENGLLAAPSAGSITIDRSEFSDNGTGTGFTHNLYANRIERLEVTNSYFHDVDTGHEIKSRAETTILRGNRIADGSDLSASYSVDLPDGGVAELTGNLIEKGLLAQNWTFVHFGGEADPSYDLSSLLIADNVFVNNMASGTPLVLNNATVLAAGGQAPAEIVGNVFHGILPGQVAVGSAQVADNTFLGLPGPVVDTSHPWDVAEPGSAVLLVVALAAGAWRRAACREGRVRP